MYEGSVNPAHISAVPVGGKQLVAQDTERQQQHCSQTDAQAQGAHPHPTETCAVDSTWVCSHNWLQLEKYYKQ